MVRLFLAVQGAGLALGGLGLLLGRRWPRLVAVGARVMFVGLALSLLPLGAVIVERGSAQPLLWGWVAFALAVPLAGRPTRIDWLILALLALVIAEVFWITPTLQWVWQKYEVAALTSFAVEHARLSRFAYLALYLAAARLSGVVVAKLPGRSLFRRGLRWLLPLGVAVAVAWPLATVRTRLLGRKPWPHDPAATELYAWARTQTPKDALFFHPDLAFRYYARRSITHAWKDLSAAIYTRGRLFAEWRRFREYENASWDLNVLVAVSRRDQIDFIVRTVDKPGPPLPEVFRNAKYIVYRVDR
jgi:hypothetical protein